MVRFQLHSFACGYPVFPAPFVEKTVLSPVNSLGTLVEIIIHLSLWLFDLYLPLSLTYKLQENKNHVDFAHYYTLSAYYVIKGE